jgi:hypothetical protein
MPRYFFDTDDGTRSIEDNEGLDLVGVEEAQVEAHRALADMARDVVPGGSQRTMMVRVRDRRGTTVLSASLSLLVRMGR